MGKLTIAKVGGSVVKDPSGLRDIAHIIKTIMPDVTVLSAFYHVTRDLTAIGHAIVESRGLPTKKKFDAKKKAESYLELLHKLHQKHLDIAPFQTMIINRWFDDLGQFLKAYDKHQEAKLLSYGEKIAVDIVTDFLKREHSLKGMTITSVEAGHYIITKGNDPMRDDIDIDRSFMELQRLSDTPDLTVIAGFYGKTFKGITTLLDFNGSDKTAAWISQALSAELLIFFKDEDGFYTKDPKKHEDAELIGTMTLEQARKLLEQSSSGPLHRNTLSLIHSGTRVEIRNCKTPEKTGTVIE